MKKIISSVFALFIIASCGREIVDSQMIDRFNYVNNSNVDINILSYHHGKKIKYDIFKDKTYSQQLDNNFGSIDDIIFYADSVKIVYGNSKYKTWKSTDENTRNIILRSNNYTKIAEKENYNEYQFVFTMQDASLTQPCNGNCN
ncbi:uncharacterized protein YxeA [Chryseobacterium sp. SORGH_AS 447]|uniref:hypothetical protein n=1 Tax=Chryseobacterium sp. SORGH_AS_0447 TaxID=3041769 RepID=UPI002789F6C9|nr:hypothetical protein [Chryseobacterium sp. SORGH_AS_0447]MDQ1160713.1 uncharacterized protein YxeA [Chryseobacterium sp. SORGH_AS_0447]